MKEFDNFLLDNRFSVTFSTYRELVVFFHYALTWVKILSKKIYLLFIYLFIYEVYFAG